MVAGTKNKKLRSGARVAAAAAVGLSATFGVFALAPVVGGPSIAFAQSSGQAVAAVQPALATTRIQGFTWNDVNRNAVNDETNNALPAVIVRVLDANGDIVIATASDGTGKFVLDLETGVEAKLRYVAPAGWTPVFPQTGVTPEGFTYYDTTITPNDTTVGIQMPFYNPNVTSTGAGSTSTGNTNSTSGDGAIIQARPFPATSTTLAATTTTVLDTLPPISTIAPPTTTTIAPATTVGGATTVAPAAPATFKVCGVMYADKNGNGVQDAGEAPLAGALLHISGANGFAKDITADGAGQFCLEGLSPGEYTNEIVGNTSDEFKGTKRSFIVNADGSVREGTVASGPAAQPTTLANTGAHGTSKQVAGGLSVVFAGLALVAGSAGRKGRRAHRG